MRRLKPFLALILNEWRDVRSLTIVCLLLVPIAQLTIDLGFLDWRGDFAGSTFVPAVVALYLAVVASDIVAAEVATGRAKTYASLPVRTSTRWLAKITFMALAGVGFSAWAYGVTATLYAAFAPVAQVTAFHDHIGRMHALWPLGGLAVVSAIVLWSTVLDRGMAAIGAAVVTAVVLGGLPPLLAMQDVELVPARGQLLTAAALLPLLFLAASYVAFVRGPAHAGTLLRRGGLACAALAAVLIPVGTVWGATLFERLHVEPGDADVNVSLISVSPNGRHALVFARKVHAHARNRAWLLGVTDGRMTPLHGKSYSVPGPGTWTDDDTLLLWTEGPESLRREFDLATGDVVRTRSLEQLQAEGEELQAVPSRWWKSIRTVGRETHIELPDGRKFTADRSAGVLARLPGLVFEHRGQALVFRDLLDGTERTVELQHDVTSTYPSPGGSYVHAWGRDGRSIINAATGEIAYGGGRWYGWIGGGTDDRYVMSWTPGEREILDLQTGERLPMPESLQDATATVRFVGPGVCLLADDDHRITLHDLAAGTERILYAPR